MSTAYLGSGAMLRDEDFFVFADTVPHMVWMLNVRGCVEYVNQRSVEYLGAEAASIGSDWLGFIHPDDAPVIVDTWMEWNGRGQSTESECRLRRYDGVYRWHRFQAQPLRDVTGALYRWIGVATDVDTEHRGQEQVRALERSTAEEAEKARADSTLAVVGAVVAAVEARDPYTAGHQRRVATIAAAIAAEIGLDDQEVHSIELAASIHDIGKLGIPTDILSYPRRLTAPEFELVKTHAQVGHDIVAGITFAAPIPAMILQHHERLDGSGYPNGLRGDEILLGARIIAVADTVEAMASHRPFRPARGLDCAIEEIRRGSGTLYDPDVVDACERLFLGSRLDIDDLG